MTKAGNHFIFDSSGHELHLTDAEYKEFVQEEHQLYMKYYAIQRSKRGIWASNLGRYLKKGEKLGTYAGHSMEHYYEEIT